MKPRALALGLSILLVAHTATAESRFDREIALLTGWLKIAPGSVVADVGAGSGEYAIALSRNVGEAGRVYATELDPEDREDIERAAREASASQVEVVEAQIQRTGLPSGCCDGVFLRGVYHHLTDPEPFARSLFETLRPGGRLAIVDFPPTLWLAFWTPEGIPDDRGGHGIAPALVIDELSAAGLVHLETKEVWPTSNFIVRDYGVLFERPATP